MLAYDVYISGTDVDIAAASTRDLLDCVAGTDFERGALLMRSIDGGASFIELTTYSNDVRSDNIDNDIFSTIFCFGAPDHENEAVLYTMCATTSVTKRNTIHKVTIDTDANTHTVDFINFQNETVGF